jgi:hypothetical protein
MNLFFEKLLNYSTYFLSSASISAAFAVKWNILFLSETLGQRFYLFIYFSSTRSQYTTAGRYKKFMLISCSFWMSSLLTAKYGAILNRGMFFPVKSRFGHCVLPPGGCVQPREKKKDNKFLRDFSQLDLRFQKMGSVCGKCS